MAEATGRVVQVLGGVVDVEFPSDNLPEIYDAVEVPRENNDPLVLEVEKHLGDNWVRCVSMDATDGLQRGVTAVATGAPIQVPVGPTTLGRIFNVYKKFSSYKSLTLRHLKYNQDTICMPSIFLVLTNTLNRRRCITCKA